MNKVLYIGQEREDLSGIVDVLRPHADGSLVVRHRPTGEVFRTHTFAAFVEVGTTSATCSLCGFSLGSERFCPTCRTEIVAARAAHVGDPWNVGTVWRGLPCIAAPTMGGA